MSDVAARIAAASGDAGALLALAIELAQENARLAGHAVALEQARTEWEAAEAARKSGQAERTRRHRNAVQRDVTLQPVTGSDAEVAQTPPPAGKEKGFICPPPNSKQQQPANAGADQPPAVVRPRARAAREPAPWMGLMRPAWAFGELPPGSAELLRPVVTAVGPEETASRLAAYCARTEPSYASLRSFVSKHASFANGSRHGEKPRVLAATETLFT
jgi:hypothetical protein